MILVISAGYKVYYIKRRAVFGGFGKIFEGAKEIGRRKGTGGDSVGLLETFEAQTSVLCRVWCLTTEYYYNGVRTSYFWQGINSMEIWSFN